MDFGARHARPVFSAGTPTDTFVYLIFPSLFLVLALLSMFPCRSRQALEAAAFFALFGSGLAIFGFVSNEQEPVILLAFLPLGILALLWKKVTDRIAKN